MRGHKVVGPPIVNPVRGQAQRPAGSADTLRKTQRLRGL